MVSNVAALQKEAQSIAAKYDLTPQQVKAMIQLKHAGSACWKPLKYRVGWSVQSVARWTVPKRVVYDNLVRKDLVYVLCEPEAKSYALTVEGEKLINDILTALSIRKELEAT